MILRDWRTADPALLRSCYNLEERSWRDDLGWDTAWTWTTIEQARVGRDVAHRVGEHRAVGRLAVGDDDQRRVPARTA